MYTPPGLGLLSAGITGIDHCAHLREGTRGLLDLCWIGVIYVDAPLGVVTAPPPWGGLCKASSHCFGHSLGAIGVCRKAWSFSPQNPLGFPRLCGACMVSFTQHQSWAHMILLTGLTHKKLFPEKLCLCKCIIINCLASLNGLGTKVLS